ncbi:hypothetical protein DL93DRAFT_2172687 [Clavulina sp. PMI_390]|nr:hypothetical protein DL93DRAFT_2172687 [Clavulina sp. PMI_390]
MTTQVTLDEMRHIARDFVGPLVIGSILNILFFGVLLIQTSNYYRQAKDDPRWLKTVVGVLIAIETFNSMFAAYIAYDYTVSNFGNIEHVTRTNFSFGPLVMSSVISDFIVQAFFAERVRRVTRQTWWAAFIIICAIVSALAGIATAVAGTWLVPQFSEFHKFRVAAIVWLVLGPVADIAISYVLVYHLRTLHTGYAGTDGILARITRTVIQTGLITVVWAIIVLILFLSIDTSFHFIFTISIAKIYANSMLSSLNARSDWKMTGTAAPAGHTGSIPNRDHKTTAIHVVTTIGVHRDQEMSPVVAVPRGFELYRPAHAHAHTGGREVYIKRSSLVAPPPPPRRDALDRLSFVSNDLERQTTVGDDDEGDDFVQAKQPGW